MIFYRNSRQFLGIRATHRIFRSKKNLKQDYKKNLARRLMLNRNPFRL